MVEGNVITGTSTAHLAHHTFVIWGPSLASGKGALNAVHALYFLPNSFSLILPPPAKGQQREYEKAAALIAQDCLAARVRFSNRQNNLGYHSIMLTARPDQHPASAYGETPEELASAILEASRRMVVPHK